MDKVDKRRTSSVEKNNGDYVSGKSALKNIQDENNRRKMLRESVELWR